jgi:hypothetical protein
MKLNRHLSWVFLGTALLTSPCYAAGLWELSAGFSYSQSNYGGSDFEWNRRWGFSVGYHFTELSSIEFSFQDVTDRTMLTGFEDTTFHDQIFGVNWVQSLADKTWIIQPYLKLGVGQLNRDASGTFAGGTTSPPAIFDSITGILGAGIRIFFTKQFGIRSEATTYLTGGVLSTWKDNFSVTFGASIYL